MVDYHYHVDTREQYGRLNGLKPELLQSFGAFNAKAFEEGAVQVGSVASSGGIPARVDIAALVTRHCSIVGSTGVGKSNLVTILVNEMASRGFPGSRIVIIDPHGEYAAALGNRARVFKPGASVTNPNEKELWVPFWVLGHSELLAIAMGGMQPNVEADIREMILERKKDIWGLVY